MIKIGMLIFKLKKLYPLEFTVFPNRLEIKIL